MSSWNPANRDPSTGYIVPWSYVRSNDGQVRIVAQPAQQQQNTPPTVEQPHSADGRDTITFSAEKTAQSHALILQPTKARQTANAKIHRPGYLEYARLNPKMTADEWERGYNEGRADDDKLLVNYKTMQRWVNQENKRDPERPIILKGAR
jgi:hypothetical protein